MCKIEENKSNDALEASVNKVVETIKNELGTKNIDDELLGGVIAEVVLWRLGYISVDGADNCRSKGDQYFLVRDCTNSFIKSIEDCAKDYIEKKFY